MEPLKNVYSVDFIKRTTHSLKKVYPSFDIVGFTKQVFNTEWGTKELKQRIHHIAYSLNVFLGQGYKKNIDVIIEWVHQLKEGFENKQSFEYLFLAHYVEVFGLEDETISLKAIEEITQFTSCEFAIRPFIIKNPEKVMKQMYKWSTHQNLNVRRLSCEGCRPRLPWGIAIQPFKKDPSLILPILDNLKNDSCLYVRKSVANNLNDISKDNPDLIIELIKNWKGQSIHTDWIVKHGARSLLKKAHAKALMMFDIDPTLGVTLIDFNIHEDVISLGEKMTFSFSLKSDAEKRSIIRIEYAVYYVKSTGKHSRKLFKISEKEYLPNTTLSGMKSISFKDLTTRKHFIGKHIIALVVNGNEISEKEFTVIG